MGIHVNPINPNILWKGRFVKCVFSTPGAEHLEHQNN